MIDKEKVIKGLEWIVTLFSNYERHAMDDEEIQSLNDAIVLLREQKPIVLCGDCKYWNAGTCLNDNVSWRIEDCGCYPDFITDSNWFCAEGEKAVKQD